MIDIPNIKQYDGPVPDRATMDRKEFAEATYYYLRYISDTFVVDAESMRSALNTQLPIFLGELESIKTTTIALRDETQSLRDETEGFKNTTQTLKIETQNLRDEVENIVEGAQATLVDGSINDSVVSTTSTWSSSKLSDAITQDGDIYARDLYINTQSVSSAPSSIEILCRERGGTAVYPVDEALFIQILNSKGVGVAIKNTFVVRDIVLGPSATIQIDIGFKVINVEKVFLEFSWSSYGLHTITLNGSLDTQNMHSGFISKDANNVVAKFEYIHIEFIDDSTIQIVNNSASYTRYCRFLKIIEFS